MKNEVYPAVALSSLSSIAYNYYLVGRLLMISFSGDYSPGSSGNDDASFMSAVAAAGIEAWRPRGLVLNLSCLSYSWGDRLQNLLAIGRQKLDGMEALLMGQRTTAEMLDIPTAIVVSELCREGVESLVREEMDLDPQELLFDQVEAALTAVRLRCFEG